MHWMFAITMAWLLPGMAAAQPEVVGLGDLGVVTYREVIPHKDNFIVEVSVGRPPALQKPGEGRAHYIVWAVEEARQLGLLQLALAMGDVYLTSGTTLERWRLKDRRVEAAVRQVVRYAREVQTEFTQVREPGGNQLMDGVRMTMEVPKYGPNSMASTLQPALREIERDQFNSGELQRLHVPAAQPEEPVYSGLVVDARGLGAIPAEGAKILDEDGNVVYSISDTNAEFALRYGVVAYAKTGSEAWLQDRIRSNPLRVKALRKIGTSDVGVSGDDAKRIRSSGEKSGFLSEGRVVFLID